MLNNDERSWIKLSLALNAALRAELAAIKRALITRGEHKHNPRWREQPRSPRGMPDGGQWVDGGGVKPRSGPKQRDPRPPRDPRDRVGGNRPPTDSLRQIFGVTPNTPAGAILTPLEPFLNLSGPGMLANEQATRNLSQTIIREIQSFENICACSAFQLRRASLCASTTVPIEPWALNAAIESRTLALPTSLLT